MWLGEDPEHRGGSRAAVSPGAVGEGPLTSSLGKWGRRQERNGNRLF